MNPVVGIAPLEAFLDREFPQMYADGRVFTIVAIGPGELTMRFEPGERHLRPGGTVSGPALFTLADIAAYAAILSHAGEIALAVTTNLNMNFLRKPILATIFCDCRILKLGKRLAVIDCLLHQGDDSEPVAQATATYSLPPR